MFISNKDPDDDRPLMKRAESLMQIPEGVIKELQEQGQAYENHLVKGLAILSKARPKRPNYRKLAFEHYATLGQILCTHCGFGVREVLEVAHLDGDRSNCEMENLAILCPNCHKMHDLGLIPTETITLMRYLHNPPDWSKRMKDAGAKAAKTRRESLERKKRQNAAQKAVQTRKERRVVAAPGA